MMKLAFYTLILFPLHALASSCECSPEENEGSKRVILLKSIALIAILAAGVVGISIPIFGQLLSFLRPESEVFFYIKSFAGGIILATGFIHILPNAFDRLSSPCITDRPWGEYPFVGFIAMSSAVGTMMVEAIATAYYKRNQFVKEENFDDEMNGRDEDDHGLGAGGKSLAAGSSVEENIRRGVISQVLELGILVHSIIIGFSLGAAKRYETIKPLIIALSFHQFFEGIGLCSCIIQANFKARARTIMALLFSLTAPFGISVGIAISTTYDANSSTTIIVEGVLGAASAGILIYMSLVVLLAEEFRNPRMQNSIKLQFGAMFALLIGAGLMALLAKWA